MRIMLENIRSFAGKHEFNLRPLTFLVGENSSGKTTLLAAVSAIMHPTRFPFSPPLNEPPYRLGSFDTIATFNGESDGRADSFDLGFEVDRGGERGKAGMVGTFGRSEGSIVVKRIRAWSDRVEMDLSLAGRVIKGRIDISSSKGGSQRILKFERSVPKGAEGLGESGAVGLFNLTVSRGRDKRSRSEGDALYETFHTLNAILRRRNLTTLSLAPIRSRPRRTYDDLRDDFNPEGDHIPTILARLLSNGGDTDEARRVREALMAFGQESGLFRSVEIRRLGRGASDPWQVQVTGVGAPANLVDVGYGVNQALPVIVESALREHDQWLLMQQPEAHLHPRAQAALGTFFARMVAEHDRRFIIETHSDYLIDRVRREVARGTIAHDKVAIVFLDKPEHKTTIHPIELDAHGNVIAAPESYRRFFLEEEINLFRLKGG